MRRSLINMTSVLLTLVLVVAIAAEEPIAAGCRGMPLIAADRR